MRLNPKARGHAVLGFCGAWLLGTSLAFGQALPSFEQVRSQHVSSDVQVLDRSGAELQVLRTDFSRRAGQWLPLEQVSPALQQAVLVSEDKRFENHAGVDWLALMGAGWDVVFSHQRRGASTISMQLVGLLDEQLRSSRDGRSLHQKWQQMGSARQLESTWSKSQILEAYLNLVSFRGELQGVDALARVLFQKQAHAMNLREAALAAALLRGPNAGALTVQRRTCTLLTDMGQGSQCEGLADFVSMVLARRAGPAYGQADMAPHFARLFLEQTGAKHTASARSSVDRELQSRVLGSVRQHLLSLQQAHVQDAAVVVMDKQTGEILAYVGSSDALSQASQVDHARAMRQAGSTLKPFLFAQAFEEQRLTAASLLHDAPLNLATGNGLYVPQNYDKSFTGWVSARTALASSLNIPAVRALTLVGPQAMVDRLLALGLPLKNSGDFYGYSLALGSADITLLSLTNAYRALAMEGQFSPWRVQVSPEGSGPVVSAPVYSREAAWLVGDILSDRLARVHTFGLDSLLSTPFWSAVKTGTSKDMRDNWAMGWSEHYVVGVWVGNSSGASMQDVSGVSGAAPIWHDIMLHLHGAVSSRQPPMPASIVPRTIDYQPAVEAQRQDYFIAGTEQSRFVLLDSGTESGWRARIAKPLSGTIIALDPDIPPGHQNLQLQASGEPGSLEPLQWFINRQYVATGGQAMWPLQPGQHLIELRGPDGDLIDKIQLNVRGALLRASSKH